MKKSLLDRFHDLNLQPPIKQAVVAGGFLLLATIIGEAFSLGATLLGRSPTTPQRDTKVATAAPAKRVSPYEFTEAVIQSLSIAQDARQTLLSIQSKGDPAADALESMTNARIAIKKLERAGDELQRFSSSDNEAINVAVQGFAVAYTQLIMALNESIKIEEKLLSVSDAQQLGAILNETSKWAAEADEGWKLLMYATAAVAHALADNKRLDEDGTLGYLSITATQREALLKELESSFGESVKKAFAAGQHPTEAAPASLWEFLHQEGWKPSDST